MQGRPAPPPLCPIQHRPLPFPVFSSPSNTRVFRAPPRSHLFDDVLCKKPRDDAEQFCLVVPGCRLHLGARQNPVVRQGVEHLAFVGIEVVSRADYGEDNLDGFRIDVKCWFFRCVRIGVFNPADARAEFLDVAQAEATQIGRASCRERV